MAEHSYEQQIRSLDSGRLYGGGIDASAAAAIAAVADATLAAAREEVERYHEAVEYAKEHLDTTLKNFVDSLVDGRTERCPACGCPTPKKSLVACCDYHGHVCEDCWGDCL